MKFFWSKATLMIALAILGKESPAKAEFLSLNITPRPLKQASAPDTMPDLDLGGGFIEFLLTGRTGPNRSFSPLLPPHNADATYAAAVQIARYDGPLPPGEVILNVTKRRVYRILPGGFMEIYNNRTDISSLMNHSLSETGQ